MFHVARRELEQKSQGENLRTALEQWSSYVVATTVAFECAVIDLHGASIKINSTALEVACPPPNFRKFLQTITHSRTWLLAVLVSNVVSWISAFTL
jgi:hypothetical protein